MNNPVIKVIILLSIYLPQYLSAIENCAQQIVQPAVNHFSIVIDRSGSMRGKPLGDTKKAVNHLIGELKSNDRANIITFESRVSQMHIFSKNKSSLQSAVNSISVGGATALYDAIAKAASSLRRESGAKIIVFLTDGNDTGSKFSINDLKSMNLSEGIFIYGIGLGNVNKTSLNNLAKATSGTYYPVSSSNDLFNIYDRVINAYYKNYGQNLSKTTAMTIRSLPSQRNVTINGKYKGKTPLKLDGLTPAQATIEVQFNRANWECSVDLKAGYRAVIDARESDLGRDLFISSQPLGASVFIDGNYVGETPMGKMVKQKKKGLFSQNKKDQLPQLRIPLVPKGTHTVRVVAVPDMEMGLEYEFSYQVKNQDRSVNVDIFNNRHEFSDGERGESKKDPFDLLDKNTGNNSNNPFDELDDF